MDVDQIVKQWFHERIATGAIARDTAAYNQAHAALPDLLTRLHGAAEAPPAGEPEAPAQEAAEKPSPAKGKTGPDAPPAEEPPAD